MKPLKILQWVFIGLCGIWGALQGTDSADSWFSVAWGWVLVALIWFVGIALAVFVVLWVLKLLGVIANLPWTLERKLKDQP